MPVIVEMKGDFKATEQWLSKMKSADIYNALGRYGEAGVAALRSATPRDTGATAESWSYEVVRTPGTWSIIWSNSNVVNGIPIAVVLQTGHGTGTGGYVQGRDYINPALKPIFEKIVVDAWKAVTSG